MTRLVPPFLHLLPARRFPQVDEVWDLAAGRKLHTLRTPEADEPGPMTRVAYRWNPAKAGMLGWTEKAGKERAHRWLALSAPFSGEPREIVALLEREMDAAAAALEYEKAAMIRDRLEDFKAQWGLGGQSGGTA